MSQENVDVVRSIYADWERGDFFSRADWAHPDIEFTVADGPEPGNWNGLSAMEDAFRAFLGAWKDYRYQAEEYRTLDDERVLALTRLEGRGKTSGMNIHELQGSLGALLFFLRSGRVKRLVVYWHRDRALADLGLKE